MAVTVRNLFKNGAFLYKMNLLAGKGGLDNPVQWVHRIEDIGSKNFLHGNELVFTAGILNGRDGWLLDITRELNETGASALVVKMGSHTQEIPAAVVEYCNTVNLPLFTIPWETKMVDMSKDFCQRIIQNERRENTIMSVMKNIIFKVGDIETQVLQMERYGFQRNSPFCFITVQAGDAGSLPADELQAALKSAAERAARDRDGLFVTFTYNECRVLVLANYADDAVGVYLEEFLQLAGRRLPGVRLHIGVSPNQTGIYDQNVNLEKALSAMEMAQKRGETAAYYDRLGIHKVLYAVQDKSVLRSFYHETIGKLEQYDRENGTGLMPFLKDYLDNNGSLQLVADKHFVHRNTVTNQLNRIKGITGLSPFELADKVKLAMGFYIKDIT